MKRRSRERVEEEKVKEEEVEGEGRRGGGPAMSAEAAVPSLERR